jgi:hypothetical protein
MKEYPEIRSWFISVHSGYVERAPGSLPDPPN